MIKFDTKQIDEFKEKQKKARELLKQDGAAMRQIAVFLDQWVQLNFKSSGGKVGGWLPYKYGGRLTTKKKSNAQSIIGHKWINGSAKLLMDTGALRLSFLPFTQLGNAGIGSDLPYSKYHEQDDVSVYKYLPQRRMLPKESEVVTDVREILANWVSVTIRKIYD